MKIKFNATDAERKKLVAAAVEILGIPQKYLGAPTFAYEIGNFLIDKEGTLIGEGSVSDDANSSLIKKLNEHGFIGEIADRSDLEETEELDRLTIELPKDGFTDIAILNLEKLVAGKASLIKKAVGAEELPILQTETTLQFPWFPLNGDSGEADAYSKFVAALCVYAKELKRVTMTEKQVENEKYAFRCFLLRLGFIGDEYKAARKILLSRLDGNTAFKTGQRGG